MGKIKFSALLLVSSFFFGCANTYQLDKKANFELSESYYTIWSSGVKGGGSGFNIFIETGLNSNFSDKNIKIQGIYFKEQYAKLKFQKGNEYQAFIKEESTTESLKPISKQITKTVIKEKIPFTLKDNEAVVKYLIKEKQHYFKIILTKKETMDIPM